MTDYVVIATGPIRFTIQGIDAPYYRGDTIHLFEQDRQTIRALSLRYITPGTELPTPPKRKNRSHP